MSLLKPDLCVVGAGSGGLSVAAAAAMMGVPVVLVEKATMGGDCLNTGCVPSKALIAAGQRAQDIRDAAAFGITTGEPQIQMARVRDHIRETIHRIAPNDSVERFRALGVQVIAGEAAFEDARTLIVGTTRIQARRFVLATGSRPAIPPIPGLSDCPYLTNETVFDLSRKVETLVVIGGGPVGLEIAQAHCRLGARVIVLEAGHILAREDAEMAAGLARALRAEGIDLREAVRIEQVAPKGSGARITLATEAGSETIEASHLLVATGRAPVTDGLGLDKAGIAHGPAGIRTDRGLRTTNRRVYAIGDCADVPGSGLRLTHVANYHAGLVIRSALFRMPAKVRLETLPRVTYTDPELAAVGLTEEEARARHGGVRVLRWPFSENDRAQAERRTTGHAKLVLDRKGRLLGAAILGPQAGELLTPWTLALTKRLTVSDVAATVAPYPTLSEVNRRVALSNLAELAGNPWLRRLLAFLRLFG